MSGRARFARREVRISVLAGAIAALLVVVAGAGLALTSKPKYTAESVLVVLPSATLDTSDSAAYYETLSRGQIVATFAEVADNLRFQDQAAQDLNLTTEQKAGLTTAVTVVPDTSVILVRTTAGSAAVAEQVADGTTALATTYLAGLSEPYRSDLVHGATGTATATGTSPIVLLALAVVVALIVGVGVQQAVYHLMTSLRARRDRRPADTTDPAPVDTTDPADPGADPGADPAPAAAAAADPAVPDLPVPTGSAGADGPASQTAAQDTATDVRDSETGMRDTETAAQDTETAARDTETGVRETETAARDTGAGAAPASGRHTSPDGDPADNPAGNRADNPAGERAATRDEISQDTQESMVGPHGR